MQSGSVYCADYTVECGDCTVQNGDCTVQSGDCTVQSGTALYRMGIVYCTERGLYCAEWDRVLCRVGTVFCAEWGLCTVDCVMCRVGTVQWELCNAVRSVTCRVQIRLLQCAEKRLIYFAVCRAVCSLPLTAHYCYRVDAVRSAVRQAL